MWHATPAARAGRSAGSSEMSFLPLICSSLPSLRQLGPATHLTSMWAPHDSSVPYLQHQRRANNGHGGRRGGRERPRHRIQGRGRRAARGMASPSSRPPSLPPSLRSRRPWRAGPGGRGGVASWGGRELLVLPVLQGSLFAGLAHLCLRRRRGTSPAAAGDEPDGARVLHPPPSPAPPHPRDDTPPPALSPSPTAANRPPLRTSTSSWLLLACVVASMAGARRPVPAPASRSCRGGDSAGRTWRGAERDAAWRGGAGWSRRGGGSVGRTCGGRARLGSGHGHGGPPLPPGHGRPPLPPCHGGARPSSLPHQRVAGLRELPPSPRPGRGAHGGGGGVGGSRWRRRRGAG